VEVTGPAQASGKPRRLFGDPVPHPRRVRFLVRLDVAGAYADNLLAWLQKLAIDHAEFSLSCGDPQRNQNYRAAFFGPKKSDPIEARACARFAVSERPKPMPAVSAPRQRRRHVPLRLQAPVKQPTRLVNQLHQLLARAYPVKGRFKTGHFWAPQNQPGYRSSLCTGNLGVTEYRRCVVAHPCTSGSPAFLPREEASRGSRG